MRFPRLRGVQAELEALAVRPFLKAASNSVDEDYRVTGSKRRLPGSQTSLRCSLSKVVGQNAGLDHDLTISYSHYAFGGAQEIARAKRASVAETGKVAGSVPSLPVAHRGGQYARPPSSIFRFHFPVPRATSREQLRGAHG